VPVLPKRRTDLTFAAFIWLILNELHIILESLGIYEFS
jgi:hypothetical protein